MDARKKINNQVPERFPAEEEDMEARSVSR